jgi:hypothetical protein
MTKPTIHLNGSDAESLLEGYMNALTAVQGAIDAVKETWPHARDYYVQGEGAAHAAMHEHNNRMAILESVRGELDLLASHVAEQQTLRAERRGR